MIAIVSESGSIENDSIIPLLEEAIDLQEIRNAIAHNPLVMNMVVGAVQKIEHRLISSKTRQPLDRASGLEEINALAVRANELSGKISEAAGNLRSEQN